MRNRLRRPNGRGLKQPKGRCGTRARRPQYGTIALHKSHLKHPLLAALVALTTCTASGVLYAQVAGTTTLAVARLDVVASGWSTKRQILGKPVYNEDSDEVGKINDLIIAPDTAVSFVIIGAEGFVGLKRHRVAIPIEQLSVRAGRFVLPGATKAAIKALPSFDYLQ